MSKGLKRCVFNREDRHQYKTSIIKLRKYNKIRELLIENRTTGSQAQVIYWDEVWEASVTRAAVHMGVRETGMRTGYRGACNWPPSWDPDQGCMQALRNNKEALAIYKIEIDLQEKRVGTLRSQGCRLSGPPMRWHMMT